MGFPKTLPPPSDQITNHSCPTCDAIRDSFSNVRWWEADNELIRHNYDSLAFLTLEAFHYYYPAYLIYSLSDFHWNNTVLEFSLYALVSKPSERMRRFAQNEKQLILEFLDKVLECEEMIDFFDEARMAREFLRQALDNN